MAAPTLHVEPVTKSRALALMRERAKRIVLENGPDSYRVFSEVFLRITTRVPGEVIPFSWNAVQADFNARRTGRDIINKARQLGTSTNEFGRNIHYALVHPNTNVGVVTIPSKDNEPKKNVRRVLSGMIDRIGGEFGEFKWSTFDLHFANGSVITIFDSGGSEGSANKKGRGSTLHRVHVTELAFYPYAGQVLDAILKAVPTPEQGGEITIESTPKGAGGSFYNLWRGAEAGANGLTPWFYPWHWAPEYTLRVGDPENDNATAEPTDEMEEAMFAYAKKTRRRLTNAQLRWWRQQRALSGDASVTEELASDPETCFVLTGTGYFDKKVISVLDGYAKKWRPYSSAELLSAMRKLGPDHPARPNLLKLFQFARRWEGTEHLRIYETPQPGHRYLISADTAAGADGGNWLVALVWNRKTKAIVASFRVRIDVAEFARQVWQLALCYGGAQIAPEANHHGGTMLHVLVNELRYPRVWHDHSGRAGWTTTPANRAPAIDDFADALRDASTKILDPKWELRPLLRIYDPLLLDECRTFVRNKNGKLEAAQGCNDDMVMAAVIGWAVLHAPRQPPPGVVDSRLEQIGG